MDRIDLPRAMAALMALFVVFFVSSGNPLAGRWRRPLRVAAMIVFAIAVLAALADIAWWLAGGRR